MAIDKACYCFIWLVLTCGTIAIITGAATPHWLKSENDNSFHEGIFQKCEPDCEVIKFWQPKIPEAARLCIIGSLGFLFLATMLSCISPWIEKDVSFAYILIDLAAFLACVAGLALYTYEYKDRTDYDWSWSYMVAWAGCGLYAIGIGLLVWAGCVDSDS